MNRARMYPMLSNILVGLCAMLAFAATAMAADETDLGTVSLPGLPVARNVVRPNDPTIFVQKPHTGYEKTARSALVDAVDMRSSKALQLIAEDKAERSYMMQVVAKTAMPVEIGDTMLCSMVVRCVKPLPDKDYGKIGVTLQSSGPPFEGYGENIQVGKEWQRVAMPFRFRFKSQQNTVAPGAAQLVIAYGFGPQIIEVGDVQLLDFGQTVGPEALPTPKLTYNGREADAAWRKAALQRIEQIRKGDLVVHVQDAAGQPVVGAGVQVSMTRHAFKWGTAVSGQRIRRMEGADSDRYRQEIPRLFNTIVFESDLKMAVWADPKVKQDVSSGIAWAEERGLSIRGHCLVWPSWRKNPPELKDKYEKDPAGLAKVIEAHVRDVTAATNGHIYDWDVLNETRTSYDWTKMFGEPSLARWVQLAKQAAPNSTLTINENMILACSNERPSDEQQQLARTVKMLLDAGAPIEGIGFQGHFAKGRLTDPEIILKVIDDFAAFKLPLRVTEYDFDTPDAELQGDFTRDFLIACFSHPAMDSFLMWGFWDGQHYAKNAPIFRKDWSLKPSGKAYQDLVLGDWWTNVSGKSGEKGDYAVRGFLGDYQIQVIAQGKQKTVPARIVKAGGTITVVLE